MSFEDEHFGATVTNPKEKNWVGWIFAALMGVVVISLAGYWFLGRDSSAGETSANGQKIPLLKADKSPIKRLPKNVGGMKVPFQDKLVYQRVEKGATLMVRERLLPTSEEPIKAGERFARLLAQTETAKKSEAEAKKLLLAKNLPPSKPKKKLIQANTDALPATSKTTPNTTPKTTGKIKPVIKPLSKPKLDAKLDPKRGDTEAQTKAGEKTTKLKPIAKPTLKTAVTPPKVKKVEVKKKIAAIKLPPKTPAPPVVKKAVQNKISGKKITGWKYTVQIAAFRSRENAERGWRTLVKKHPSTLARQPHSVAKVRLKKKGIYFRLRAGSFARRNQARALCKRLQAAKQSCITVRR